MASSDTTLTTRMAQTGVLNRGETWPKTRFGRTPSRPMANRIRATDACEVSAEPSAPGDVGRGEERVEELPAGRRHHIERARVDIGELLDGNTNCDT